MLSPDGVFRNIMKKTHHWRTMMNNNDMLLIRKQAEIAKASLAELNCDIPRDAESVHARARLAVEAILAITNVMEVEKSEAV